MSASCVGPGGGEKAGVDRHPEKPRAKTCSTALRRGCKAQSRTQSAAGRVLRSRWQTGAAPSSHRLPVAVAASPSAGTWRPRPVAGGMLLTPSRGRRLRPCACRRLRGRCPAAHHLAQPAPSAPYAVYRAFYDAARFFHLKNAAIESLLKPKRYFSTVGELLKGLEQAVAGVVPLCFRDKGQQDMINPMQRLNQRCFDP